MGSVMHGMASGVGFSMASRLVDSVIGPRTVEVNHTGNENNAPAVPQQVQSQQTLCGVQQDQVNQCLSNASDMTYCQSYFEALKQCQQDEASNRY